MLLTSSVRRVAVVLFAVILLALSSRPARALTIISNPSFESSGLTGWTTAGDGNVNHVPRLAWRS